MTVFLLLLGAGVLSWMMRLAFIVLLPASRLPQRARRFLDHGVVAIPAALVATRLAGSGGLSALVVPSPALLALLVSGVVAWRTEHLAGTVAAGAGAFWLLGLAWGHLPGPG
jgi:branched-subunit amino acid transport protein